VDGKYVYERTWVRKRETCLPHTSLP